MYIYHATMKLKTILRYREIFPDTKLNVIISYADDREDNAKFISDNRDCFNNLILDSGTWSLNNSKNVGNITFEGYLKYLKIFSNKFDFYFNYDEDFSKNGFETNYYYYQKILEESGFNPVPVIHDCYGEEIDIYIKRGYKLVSIGSGELRYASLEELYNITNSFYSIGTKVHFLGCTSYKRLASVPVYSCDSSSWTQIGAKGRSLLYWNPEKEDDNKTDKIFFGNKLSRKRMESHFSNYEYRFDFEAYLERKLGLTLDSLTGENSRENMEIANLHYFVQLEKIITEKHRTLGFSFDE